MNLSSHLIVHDPHKWSMKIAEEMELQRQIIKKLCQNKNVLTQSKILLIKGIKETLKAKLNQVTTEQAQRLSIKKTEDETLRHFPNSENSYIVISDKCLRQVHTIQKSQMMKLQELISKKNSIRKGKKRTAKQPIENIQVSGHLQATVIPNTKMISSAILIQSTINDNITTKFFENNVKILNSFKVSTNVFNKNQQRLQLELIVKEIRSIRSKNNYMIKILKHGCKQQQELMVWFKFRLTCLEEEIRRKVMVVVEEVESSEKKKQSETTGSPNQKENCQKYQLNKSTKGSSIRKNLLLKDPSSDMSYLQDQIRKSQLFSNQSRMIPNIHISEKSPKKLSDRLVSANSHCFQPRGGREMSIPNSSASNANCSQMFSNNFFNDLQYQLSLTNNDSAVVMSDDSRLLVNDNNKSDSNANNGGQQKKEKKLQLWEIRLKELNETKKTQKLKQLSQKSSQQKQNQQIPTVITATNTEHNFSKKVENHSIQIADKNVSPFSSTNTSNPQQQYNKIPISSNSNSSKSKLNQFLSKINLQSNKENTSFNINAKPHQPKEKSNSSAIATQLPCETRGLQAGNIFAQTNVSKEQNIFMTKQSNSSNPFTSSGSKTLIQQNPFSSNPFENPFSNSFGGTPPLISPKKSSNCFTQNGSQSSNAFQNKMSNNPFSNPFKPSSKSLTTQQNESIFGSSRNSSKFSSMNRMKNIFS